jgi:hypothetical protein
MGVTCGSYQVEVKIGYQGQIHFRMFDKELISATFHKDN